LRFSRFSRLPPAEPMTDPVAQIVPAGPGALYVRVGEGMSEAVNDEVLRLSAAIRHGLPVGVFDVVPGYASVYVEFDPLRWSFRSLARAIRSSVIRFEPKPRGRLVRIPVQYGGEFGPDLSDVATRNKLSEEEVITIHSSCWYRVYFLGFTPGFAFLGGMDPRIAAPRLARPRLRVPRGAVGIAGEQTGVYPVESPGGWRIIGRTMVRLYDPRNPPGVLLRPGDLVRFLPVPESSA